MGYKYYKSVAGDGVWFDNLYAYGNSAMNAAIGARFIPMVHIIPGCLQTGMETESIDQYGIFYENGRTYGSYSKNENQTLNLDLDFTSQVQNHLIEIGGGVNYNILRNFLIGPAGLASDNLKGYSKATQFYSLQPSVFGYDITGTNHTSSDGYSSLVLQGDTTATSVQTNFAPKKPVIAYAYMQDRFELNDIVLNVGLRADYFDTQGLQVSDPTMPFVPSTTDPSGYALVTKKKKPEFYLSPRIGLGFPITSTTVFHAQYGKFIQEPPWIIYILDHSDVAFLKHDASGNIIVGGFE